MSMTARFFDPLGIVSPVTILFKMFFQQLCEARVGWDDPLTGDLLKEWTRLYAALQGAESLMIPRCYLNGLDPPNSVRLVGFCDASAKAYAAVVYLRLEGESHNYVCEIPSCQVSCLSSRRYDHSPLGALVSFVVVQAVLY